MVYYYYYYINKWTVHPKSVSQWFGYILQNIFFCIQQKKEIYTRLEQHEGE